MKKRSNVWWSVATAAAIALVVLAVACGPAATPTPTPKPTPTPAPMATPTPMPAATATPTPAAVKQTARHVHARNLVNPMVGMPWGAAYRDWEISHTFGVTESLFVYKDGNAMAPHLGTYWKLADDGKKVTIGVRQGTKWNPPAGVSRDFGELTAEDVVWWLNISNSAVNAQSTHGDAGDFAAAFGEAKLVDKYTLDVPLVRPLYFALPVTEFGAWAVVAGSVFSKKVFDTMGPEWMSENAVGTGPMIVKSWKSNDRGVVEALPSHWSATSLIKEFEFLQVPELSSRVAMLKTGTIDSATVDFKVVSDLVSAGLKFDSGPAGAAFAPGGVVTESASLLMMGNLWEEKDARTGAALEPWKAPAYQKDYPWVGNPWGSQAPYTDTDNPAGMDDMEQARLVREGMAYAIDREGIVKNILHSMGWAIPTEYASPNRTEVWKPEYAIPYDPKKADELLTKAGFPKKGDGTRFDLTIYNYACEVGEVCLELGEAVAANFNGIGIKVTLDRSDYGAVVSPMMRKREGVYPIIKNGDLPTNVYPADWNLPPSETSITRGGWSCGFESPFLADLYFKSLAERDRAKRVQMQKDAIEYMLKQHLMIGIVEIPRGVVYNPKKVKSWNSRLGMFMTLWGPQFIVPAE